MFNSISPYVRLATHSKINPPWTLKSRVIFDYEIIYLEEGEFELTVDGKCYFCRRDDVILLRPGVSHSIRITGNEQISQPHVHFDMVYDYKSPEVEISFRERSEMSDYEIGLIRNDILKGIMEGPVLKIKDRERVKAQLFGVIDVFRSDDSLRNVLCQARMLELLYTLFRDNASFPQNERLDPVQGVKEYIDRNFENSMTLDSLSHQFNYDKYYLEKCFSSKYGISIKRYYTKKRLKAIKTELEKMSISEVADKYSFSSIYAFSRFFKNNTGLSPSKWKKENFSSPYE